MRVRGDAGRGARAGGGEQVPALSPRPCFPGRAGGSEPSPFLYLAPTPPSRSPKPHLAPQAFPGLRPALTSVGQGWVEWDPLPSLRVTGLHLPGGRKAGLSRPLVASTGQQFCERRGLPRQVTKGHDAHPVLGSRLRLYTLPGEWCALGPGSTRTVLVPPPPEQSSAPPAHRVSVRTHLCPRAPVHSTRTCSLQARPSDLCQGRRSGRPDHSAPCPPGERPGLSSLGTQGQHSSGHSMDRCVDGWMDGRVDCEHG